jgi:hypothetical protein
MLGRPVRRNGMSARSFARVLAEVTRAPAALTVPGDVVCGAARSSLRPAGRVAALVCSSACLYWAGMALNDYADRDVDAAERPGRPIPAGRIRPGAALGLGTALTATGLTLARLADPRRTGVSVSLAAVVWAYDFWLKNTPAGPAAMSAARMLNVQLGADPGRPGEAIVPAAAVAAHTYLVTVLSRHEVSGARPAVPLLTTAGTALIALAAGLRGTPAGTRPPSPGRLPPRLAQAGLALAYAGLFGFPQAATIRDGSPRRVQRAVRSGILALIPLQAALVTGQGAPGAALAVASLSGIAGPFFRQVSPT